MGKFSFAGVDVEGLFIHPAAIYVMELLQLSCPLRCFVETIDMGEVAGKYVDCFARLGVWPGGDMPAYDALGMDKAALDGRLWPQLADGPDPRKVDTSGVSYAAWVSVAELSASKSSGARRLHQECRLRVL